MVSERTQLKDIAIKPEKPLVHITGEDLMSLPYPCIGLDHPGIANLITGGHDDSRDHR